MATYFSKKVDKIEAVNWNGTLASIKEIQKLTNASDMSLFFSDGELRCLDVVIPNIGTFSIDIGNYLTYKNGVYQVVARSVFKELWELRDNSSNVTPIKGRD